MTKPRRRPKGDTLTPRQLAFAQQYSSGTMTATAAALAAGYSPRSARVIGGELLKHPLVVAELDKVAEKVRERSAMTAEKAMREAEENIEYAKSVKNASAVATLVIHRARLAGLLVERAQIEVATVDICAALADAKARAFSHLRPAIDADVQALPSPDGERGSAIQTADQADRDRGKFIPGRFQD